MAKTLMANSWYCYPCRVPISGDERDINPSEMQLYTPVGEYHMSREQIHYAYVGSCVAAGKACHRPPAPESRPSLRVTPHVTTREVY